MILAMTTFRAPTNYLAKLKTPRAIEEFLLALQDVAAVVLIAKLPRAQASTVLSLDHFFSMANRYDRP
jgi:hypothetical protein